MKGNQTVHTHHAWLTFLLGHKLGMRPRALHSFSKPRVPWVHTPGRLHSHLSPHRWLVKAASSPLPHPQPLLSRDSAEQGALFLEVAPSVQGAE
jgi:hypothetical protein